MCQPEPKLPRSRGRGLCDPLDEIRRVLLYITSVIGAPKQAGECLQKGVFPAIHRGFFPGLRVIGTARPEPGLRRRCPGRLGQKAHRNRSFFCHPVGAFGVVRMSRVGHGVHVLLVAGKSCGVVQRAAPRTVNQAGRRTVVGFRMRLAFEFSSSAACSMVRKRRLPGSAVIRHPNVASTEPGQFAVQANYSAISWDGWPKGRTCSRPSREALSGRWLRASYGPLRP
jgi:hypothetical protein